MGRRRRAISSASGRCCSIAATALPSRLVRAAEYALAHPDEIAFGTVASVAEAAEIQPSALIRFAKALGYNGFSELQEVFRHRLRERWPPYGERLAKLRTEAHDGPAGLLKRFSASSALSLAQARRHRRARGSGAVRSRCWPAPARSIFSG